MTLKVVLNDFPWDYVTWNINILKALNINFVKISLLYGFLRYRL